jgi:hypothetical protein
MPRHGTTDAEQARHKPRSGIAARSDNLATNYLAFIQLAAIRIWPRNPA